MGRYLTFLLFLLVSQTTLAQNKTLSPLEKMVDKLSKAKSIEYSELMYEKSFFSNDTVQQNNHKRLFFAPSGQVHAADIATEIDGSKIRTVLTNNRLYYLESDSTYTIKEPAEYTGNFGELFTKTGIIETIKRHPKKITQLNDTLINGSSCYHYKIKILDSIIEGERNFSYSYISIDKKNYLPVASIHKGYGIIMQNGVKIGSVDLDSWSSYNDMKLDIGENDLMDFQVPDRYRPYEKVTLLAEGTTAPAWDGLDVDGNRYTSKQFEGKVQLLFLSDINCPANQLSISMLNKLADHYKNQNVQIIGVYPENSNKVNSYLQSNPLKFPVIYNGIYIKNSYNAPGAPYFYIIDPKGTIAKSVALYSTDWQQQFTEIIDKLLILSDQ